MDKGMMIPTPTPTKALMISTRRIWLNAPAMQPPAVYNSRPIIVRVFAPNLLQSRGKILLVITIKIAGMLMIICTSTGELSTKYSWITPKAGAIAAPAITVKSDRDRMLTTSGFAVVSSDFIMIPP